MTVVLMQRTKSKITLFADGRALRGSGTIATNMADKIIKPNNNIIIGFCGFAPDVEFLHDLTIECETAREVVDIILEAPSSLMVVEDSYLGVIVADSNLNVYEIELPSQQVSLIKENFFSFGSGADYMYGITCTGKKQISFNEFCRAVKYLSANQDTTIGGKCTQMEVKYEKVN